MTEFRDLEWDGGDDESFMSAIASPLGESFTAYSICVNPVSLNIDVSDHSEFVDALSEEESEDDSYAIPEILQDENDGEVLDMNESDVIEENNLAEHREEQTPVLVQRNAQGANEIDTTKGTRTKTKAPVIKSLTFNQDRDCIAMATSTGFQIQTLDTNPNESCQLHKIDMGGTNCIQILHRTSLVALVKSKTPRMLSIVHARNGAVVKKISFTSAVRRVEMNKMCMVVLTASGELHVFIYRRQEGERNIVFLKSFSILNEAESARTMTADGAMLQGSFFELSSHVISGCSWLVTKSKDGVGSVSIYKISCEGGRDGDSSKSNPTMTLVDTIEAHGQSIAKVAIGGLSSGKGDSVEKSVFATASIQGTVIRVFSLSNCHKLFELHRGSSSCTIYSVAFNQDATLLSVSGSKGTVHVFQLTEENKVDFQEDSSSMKNTVWRVVKRLTSKPKKKEEKVVRSFARIRLKGEHAKVSNTLAMLKTADLDDGQKEDNVAICVADGKMFQYAVQGNGKKRPTRADDLLVQKDSE